MSKPRLLVLASTYPRWSGDHEPGFVHELCRRLTDRFAVTALVPHARNSRASESMDGVAVVRFRYAPERLETLVNDGGMLANLRRSPWKWLLVPGFFVAQVLAVRRMIKATQPDVVHAHWLIPQGTALAALSSVGCSLPPVLLTSHGADLFSLRKGPAQMAKRRAARLAARMTVVSQAMQASAVELGVDPRRIEVRPMGVDFQDRFTPAPLGHRHAREVLFVGRLVEKKGLRFLIAAMPAVLEAHPRARLRIAGFGPDGATLRSMVEALGLTASVDFLGPLPQHALPDLYRRATVFVAPFVEAASGDQEGLGLVVAEATACGCPVILSDLPATQDYPMDRVPPGDATALAVRIIKVLDDPASFERHALDVVRPKLAARLDWTSVADGYADLIDRVHRGAEEFMP